MPETSSYRADLSGDSAPIRISVLIPTYCRTEDLIQTIERTRQQAYASYEIVVVDDGTPGDAVERAIAVYPEVRYIRLERNVGLIGARNFGATECRGDYILNLDDDSWLVENDAMARIVQFMDEDAAIGVAALNIGLKDRGYLWLTTLPSRQVRHYIGCGNVYRRSIIRDVGGYVEEFYRQGEELERALRIADAGYKVMTLPSVRVFHSESAVNRNFARNMAFEAVNCLRRELLRAPLVLLPVAIARFVAITWLLRRQLDWQVYWHEIKGRRVPLSRLLREKRRPVRVATYLLYLRLPFCSEVVD